MIQTPDGLKIYSFSGAGLLVLASEHNKAIAALEQQNAELLAAMIRTERKLSAYVGVCTGDKELLLTVLPMAREAIAKAGGEI